MTTVTVGHKVNMSITYLDANGNPMLTLPIPDTPPTWVASFGIVTVAVAPGGLTAVATCPTIGTDSILMTVIVGGKTFTATLAITVVAGPQVLTSVQIAATIV